MEWREVCAVVVTFHPDRTVAANLAAIRPQVAGMTVVDNGSPAEELAGLRGEAARLGFTLLENGANLGIAAALNRGVRWAAEHGFRSVLLLDQDSRVTEDFAAVMLACAERSALGERLAILVPRYVDSRSGKVLPPPATRTGGALQAATTSGSLMPLAIFAAAGCFWEELFIDGVDYEYSLRLRSLGYSIAECPEAVLLHAPGTPIFFRLPGTRRIVQAANYSPLRRYYQERNKVLIARRHWREHKAFLAGQFIISIKDMMKIVLMEPGKLRKIRFFLRGVVDGVRGRSGPFA